MVILFKHAYRNSCSVEATPSPISFLFTRMPRGYPGGSQRFVFSCTRRMDPRRPHLSAGALCLPLSTKEHHATFSLAPARPNSRNRHDQRLRRRRHEHRRFSQRSHPDNQRQCKRFGRFKCVINGFVGIFQCGQQRQHGKFLLCVPHWQR